MSITEGMSIKLTRRQLAGIAAGSLVAAEMIAQAPVTNTDWDRVARESHRENSQVLAKFDIQISLEPAFHFKA